MRTVLHWCRVTLQQSVLPTMMASRTMAALESILHLPALDLPCHTGVSGSCPQDQHAAKEVLVHSVLASAQCPQRGCMGCACSPQMAMDPMPMTESVPLVRDHAAEFHGVAGWPAQSKLVPTVIVCELLRS